jgi:hypothetical protein
MDNCLEGKMKKWLALTTVLGSLACSDSGSSGPTSPTAPPANIAASYAATVTASSTCSANLPTETRALDFFATITQTGAAVQVQLIAHVPGVPEVTFSGTVSGQTVNFPSFSFSGTGRGASVTLVATGGNATVAADGSIAGTLSGTYQTPSASCNAANHELLMVKPKPPAPRP